MTPPLEILVLGGSGFLGAQVCRLAHASGTGCAYASRRPLPPGARTEVAHHVWDAADAGATERLLGKTPARAVILTAALARAGDCERDPRQARIVNALAPECVARLCRERGLRLVHVSTDLVHGGRPPRSGLLYDERDEPSPVQVYGRSKAEGERRVLATFSEALVVRLPLLTGDSLGRGLGASDSIAAALARGEAPLLFVDEVRTPLDVVTAARALLELAGSDRAGILNVAGPERLTRWELGVRVRAALGLAGELARARSADHAGEAQRPRDVGLCAVRARRSLATPLPAPFA